jgi:hypothetical protein
MVKHVYLSLEMVIDDLPEDATDTDYGNDVLENIKACNYTLADMGHGVMVQDDDNPSWRCKPCLD